MERAFMADEFTVWVGLSAAVFGGLVTWLGLGKRIDADERLAEKKFEFDKELAQRKFDLDRSQLIHRRRFELAETLLADAYLFRDLLHAARYNVQFGNEGESRAKRENESENLKREKDRYFVPIERLQKHNEFINGFWAKKHSAIAHFGPDAAKAFNLLHQAISNVQIASQMLIDTVGYPNNDPEFIAELRADLWVGYAKLKNKDDRVAKQIEDGVLLFEKLCQPVLEWAGA
jgi:hypothetical protein